MGHGKLITATVLLLWASSAARAENATRMVDPGKDTDGDGVPDPTDKCPRQRETFRGIKGEDGCPGRYPVVVGRRVLHLRKPILFTFGGPAYRRIQPSSIPTVDAVAATLKKHRRILKLEIRVHTDSRGTSRYNQRLSAFLAEAVKLHLVKRGIQAKRLAAVGVGEAQPLCRQPTAVCRARNRRVELVIVRYRGRKKTPRSRRP